MKRLQSLFIGLICCMGFSVAIADVTPCMLTSARQSCHFYPQTKDGFTYYEVKLRAKEYQTGTIQQYKISCGLGNLGGIQFKKLFVGHSALLKSDMAKNCKNKTCFYINPYIQVQAGDKVETLSSSAVIYTKTVAQTNWVGSFYYYHPLQSTKPIHFLPSVSCSARCIKGCK